MARKPVARNGEALVGRPLDDGTGQWVLAVGLGRRRQPEQRLLVASDRDDRGHDVLAAGERPGLVEEHCIDVAHSLQRQTVLDQNAVAGGDRRREGDDERNRQPQGVRTGDHQHRHRADDGLIPVAEQSPDEEGYEAGPDRNVDENCREAVGERLGAGAGGLGLLDQALDAGQRGVGADRLHPDADRGAGDDGAGDDLVARSLRNWPRLAGDHRLIELRLALADLPVGRYSGAGPHQDHIARVQGGEGNDLHAVRGDPLRLVRQERRQGVERPSGLADGPHLLPVAEEHDVDEEGQLPPEIEIEPAKGGRQAGGEGDDDRQRDEEHHPRLAGQQLLPAAGEEDGTAVEEDDRAEDRSDQGAAGEHRHRKAEPLLDHVTVEDDRHRQRRADPEAPCEHLGVSRVAAAMARGGAAMSSV